jgi:hypothetical protein
MKTLAVVILTCWCCVVQAQIPAILVPTPASVVLQIGSWIWNSSGSGIRTVTVQAHANSAAEALSVAQRMAVEQAVGTVVISAAHAESNRMVSDSVWTYSGARIERYDIVEQTATSVTIRAQVRAMRMHTIPVRTSSSEAFVTPATTQHVAWQSGDAVVQQFLTTYPANSFSVSTQPPEWIQTAQREQELRVRFQVTWSDEWLRAWTELAEATHTDMRRLDRVRQNVILAQVLDTRPQVQITVLDAGGQQVYQACRAYSELDWQQVEQYGQPFVTWSPGRITFNNTRLTGHLALRVPPGQAERYHSVRITIQPFKQCV